MLLGARTAAWGGKALPYDAEVEYLESHAQEYIDTGLVITDAKTPLEIELYFTGTGESALGNAFGAMSADNASDGIYMRCYRSLTNYQLDIPIQYLAWPSISSTSFNSFSISDVGGTANIVVNGTVYRKAWTSRTFMSNTIYLFAAHVDSGAFRKSQIRLKKFRYGDHVLIPVKKGNEGFMFDTLTGNMLGNISGRGYFDFPGRVSA